MTWVIVVALVGVAWCVLPLPLAVVVGRLFAAREDECSGAPADGLPLRLDDRMTVS